MYCKYLLTIQYGRSRISHCFLGWRGWGDCPVICCAPLQARGKGKGDGGGGGGRHWWLVAAVQWIDQFIIEKCPRITTSAVSAHVISRSTAN